MVVDPFSVPTDMDRNGMTGAVFASELLDKVATLEAQTQSARAQSSYENSWSDSKGVEVPYTGVSLGELRRQARDWLGSENHLSGDVVRLPGGKIAISFRTGDKSSGRVEGLESDTDAVMNQAALAIFRATQPYRYSVYRNRLGDVAESTATLKALARSPKLNERLWAMHGLALGAPTDDQSAAIYRRVLQLRPDFLPAIGNLPGYALNAGHEEEAYRGYQRSAEAYARGEPDYTPDYSDVFALDHKSQVASMEGDLEQAAVLAREAQEHGGGGPVLDAARPFWTAQQFARNHDFGDARRALTEAGYIDPAVRSDAVGKVGPQLDLAALFAIAADDWAGRMRADEQLMSGYIGTGDNSQFNEREKTKPAVDALRVEIAYCLAHLRQVGEAQAILAPVAGDYDGAIRVRAFLAALSGDTARSDAMFGDAVARTASLPAAHFTWAEAALATGRPALAAQEAERAHDIGPRWADALNLWGDALNAQNRVAEARSKYAEAAKLAPQWGRLRMNWANALWRLHRRPEAVAQMRAAAGTALSPSDRTLLQRMWQSARAKIG
jgi:tetratricopeptide (TPR) repeat protein